MTTKAVRRTLCAAMVLAGAAQALAGEADKKMLRPATPLDDSWRFSLSLPAWVPWMEGDSGVNGIVPHVSLGPDTLIPKVDMIADVRFEAHKGRFGVLGEFLYMSLSDGIGTKTMVKKLDLQCDQMMGDLALSWRVLDGERGYLDVVGGVRYTNLFQQAVTQANSARIDEQSTRLVDGVADALRERIDGGGLRKLIAAKLPDAPVLGRPPTLPTAPLDGRLGERIRERVEAIIAARAEALRAAVQTRAQAVGAAAQAAADRRVNALKQDLSKEIARVVESKLNTRAARLDDWFDPYVGLRGRYVLSEKFYVTAKADIGGFGVGSDLTWTAEAALGWNVTKNVYSEIGYRALGVDYEKDGFVYDMVTHGPQLTLGVAF